MPARVFLASRFGEHRALRAEVTSCLTRYGFLAVNLDDGRADARSVERRSLSEVRGSDIIVVLVGPEYPDEDVTGPTMTRLELVTALECQKTVLGYTLPGIGERSPAARFRDDLGKEVVIGGLEGRDREDAVGIIADIWSHLWQSGDFDGVPAGRRMPELGLELPTLRDEAVRLGFLSQYEGSVEEPTGGPVRARVREETQLAFRAVQRRRADVALKHLHRACDLDPLDWVAAYAKAWLIARAGRLGLAREGLHAARYALETAGDPIRDVGGTDGSVLIARRLDATRFLAARLAVAARELGEARELLDSLLADSPGSARALAERLRLAGIESRVDATAGTASDVECAVRDAKLLARENAPLLVQVLGSTALVTLRREVERGLAGAMPSPRLREEVRRGLSLEDAVDWVRRDFGEHRRAGRAMLGHFQGRMEGLAGTVRALGFDWVELCTVDGVSNLLETSSTDRARCEVRCSELERRIREAPHLQSQRAAAESRVAASAAALRLADKECAAIRRRIARNKRLAASVGAHPGLTAGVALFCAVIVVVLVGWMVVPITDTRVRAGLVTLGLPLVWSRRAAVGNAGHALSTSWLRRRGRLLTRRMCRAEARREGLAGEASEANDELTQVRRGEDSLKRTVQDLEESHEEVRRVGARIDALNRLLASEHARIDDFLDSERVRARIVQLVREKNDFAGWATVLAIENFALYADCRAGTATVVDAARVGHDSVAGGVRWPGLVHRLVLVRERAEGGLVVTDLGVYADDPDDQVGLLSLEAHFFEDSERPSLVGRRKEGRVPAESVAE